MLSSEGGILEEKIRADRAEARLRDITERLERMVAHHQLVVDEETVHANHSSGEEHLVHRARANRDRLFVHKLIEILTEGPLRSRAPLENGSWNDLKSASEVHNTDRWRAMPPYDQSVWQAGYDFGHSVGTKFGMEFFKKDPK